MRFFLLPMVTECVQGPPDRIRMVAVGTGVSPGPPHRSEQAGLPHSALISGFGVETIPRPRMTDVRRWQPSIDKWTHPLPIQPPLVASSPERAIPQVRRLGAELPDRAMIGRHAVVPVVPTKYRTQPFPLSSDRKMSSEPKFLLHLAELGTKPFALGISGQQESALPALPSNMREAQEAERLRFARSVPFPLSRRKATEADEPGFLAVQLQAKLRHSLVQQGKETLVVVAMLEAHHKVVSVTHDDDFPPARPAFASDVPTCPRRNEGRDWPARARSSLPAGSQPQPPSTGLVR